MIKLFDLIKEIEEGVGSDVEFVSPDDTNVDYYRDLNRIEIESGINIWRWKHLSVLAIRNGRCVGALYEGTNKGYFSFDIVVDKRERRQGIGAKLIDIGLANFKEISDQFYLILDVVNAHLIPHLERRGLRIIGKNQGRIVMTLP